MPISQTLEQKLLKKKEERFLTSRLDHYQHKLRFALDMPSYHQCQDV